jgi:hypothetical protein
MPAWPPKPPQPSSAKRTPVISDDWYNFFILAISPMAFGAHFWAYQIRQIGVIRIEKQFSA